MPTRQIFFLLYLTAFLAVGCHTYPMVDGDYVISNTLDGISWKVLSPIEFELKNGRYSTQLYKNRIGFIIRFCHEKSLTNNGQSIIEKLNRWQKNYITVMLKDGWNIQVIQDVSFEKWKGTEIITYKKNEKTRIMMFLQNTSSKEKTIGLMFGYPLIIDDASKLRKIATQLLNSITILPESNISPQSKQ